jgi:hypothetical protein
VADKSLSQSEIDSLISGYTTKDLGPKELAVAEKGDEGPLPNVKKVSLQDIGDRFTSPSQGVSGDALAAINLKLAEMSDRLGQLELKVAKIASQSDNPVAKGNYASASDLKQVVAQVQSLSDELGGIVPKLKGTLGYDAYHTFKCDNCGSTGTVATVFKCTSCGTQNWRGWFPKK